MSGDGHDYEAIHGTKEEQAAKERATKWLSRTGERSVFQRPVGDILEKFRRRGLLPEDVGWMRSSRA